jgi:hypothetical protein
MQKSKQMSIHQGITPFLSEFESRQVKPFLMGAAAKFLNTKKIEAQGMGRRRG